MKQFQQMNKQCKRKRMKKIKHHSRIKHHVDSKYYYRIAKAKRKRAKKWIKLNKNNTQLSWRGN